MELVSHNLRSRTLNGLDTHHLQFGCGVGNLLDVPTVQDVSFLRHPDTTVCDHLAFHHHTILVGVSVLCEFVVCLGDDLLEMFVTDLVKKLHGIFRVELFDQGCHVDVDRISVNRNYIVIIRIEKNIHLIVHGLLCGLDRTLSGQSHTLRDAVVKVTEPFVRECTIERVHQDLDAHLLVVKVRDAIL